MSVSSSNGNDAQDAPVRIRASRSQCRGWGNCQRWAPEVYFLDEDGLIGFQFLEVPGELAMTALLGAGACPERAIQVLDARLSSDGFPYSVIRTETTTNTAKDRDDDEDH